jgi:hypothetical protein
MPGVRQLLLGRVHMRKSSIQLAVAIYTFAVGVAIASLWAASPFGVVKEGLTPSPNVTIMKAEPAAPEGWQRVEERKLSLYLPPDMREREIAGDMDSSIERSKYYSNRDLWISYMYGKNLSCDPHPAMAYQFSRIKVAGKSAILFVYQPDETWVDLCVPDMGDGKTSLWLRASGRDRNVLKLARQAIDSIEFR